MTRLNTNKTSFIGDKPVNRIGLGAMQLAGPGMFGPPRDPDAARAVLRQAIELGADHVDTAQYYGPDVVNDLIRDALYPYPENLKLVTKVGARRDREGAWLPAQSPAELRSRRRGQPPLSPRGADGPGQPPTDRSGASAIACPSSWAALEDLRSEGKLDLIGISEAGDRHRPPRARASRHRRGPERL